MTAACPSSGSAVMGSMVTLPPDEVTPPMSARTTLFMEYLVLELGPEATLKSEYSISKLADVETAASAPLMSPSRTADTKTRVTILSIFKLPFFLAPRVSEPDLTIRDVAHIRRVPSHMNIRPAVILDPSFELD